MDPSDRYAYNYAERPGYEDHDLEKYRKELFDKIRPLPDEEWRTVVTPRFATDAYLVSNHGRIVSLPRWRNSPNGRKVWKGKLIKPSPQRSGHLRVNIHADGHRYMVHIHRLVMWAFVGPQEQGVQVLHLDGNLQNNRLDNLAYESPWENNTDTFGPAGITGTGIVVGSVLEQRIRAALDGKDDHLQILTAILNLIESSKRRSLNP